MSFLPGFHPGFMFGKSVVPITSCALFDYDYASSTNVFTLPSTIERGDLVVLFSTDSDGSAVPLLTISGVTCTNLSSDARNNGSGLFSRHQYDAFLADGSEAGASITYSRVISHCYMLVFRANRELRSFTVGTSAAVFSTGNPAAASVPATASTDEPTLTVAWYYCQNAAPDPRDMTPTKDGEATDALTSRVAWLFQLVAGASDVAVDTDDNGLDNGVGGVWIGLD